FNASNPLLIRYVVNTRLVVDRPFELALFGARDKKWLIMPIERPGTFQITPPGFDAATARVR
ncbi:MAG: hypothetical protein QOG17_1485, partial [Gammaproteobacteria bacterium]|nr:hypothetical protein [Gammaproteobacteria bacterium]